MIDDLEVMNGYKKSKFLKRFGDMCVIIVSAFVFSLSLVSCDEHEHIDLDIHPGHILLKSGRVISSADYFANGDSTAIGIVFSEQISNSHYLVVSLDELPPVQFCDSIGGMIQGTSCDRTTLDGMENTYALQGSIDKKTFRGSPLANAVSSSHAFALAEFIPSVKEMKMLYSHFGKVNGIISQLHEQRPNYYNAVPLSRDGVSGDCWYWTSTEVKENQQNMAWRFSMSSGTEHESGKDIFCHARKISIYYPNEVK